MCKEIKAIHVRNRLYHPGNGDGFLLGFSSINGNITKKKMHKIIC